MIFRSKSVWWRPFNDPQAGPETCPYDFYTNSYVAEGLYCPTCKLFATRGT